MSSKSLGIVAALVAVGCLLSAPLTATAQPLSSSVAEDPAAPAPIGDGSDDGIPVPGVTVEPVIPGEQSFAPNARSAAIVHTVWFSLVSTDGASGFPATGLADAHAMVDRMNQYYQAQTDGQISVVFGGYETRSYPQTGCTLNGMYSNYSNVAFGGQFANFSWENTYKHLMMMTVNPCGGGGLGSVGGNGGLVVADSGLTGSYADSVGFHEFGHNLGLEHADSSICLNSTTFDDAAAQFQLNAGNCPTEQYGDDLDVMGASYNDATPNVSAAGRITSGMLDDYISLQAPLANSTYSINSLGAGSGNRALVIKDPTSGEYYFIEYRTNDGYDATSVEFRASNLSSPSCKTVGAYAKCHFDSSTSAGVVRVEKLVPGGNPQQTTVLAAGYLTGHASDPLRRDQHLDAGESFTSASGAFTVTVASLGGGTAQISVTAPNVATTTSLSANRSTQANGSSWKVKMTAVVTSGALHPAGIVTFTDGTTTLGTSQVNTVTGFATLLLPRLPVAGVHFIAASFTPSVAGYSPSVSSGVSITVFGPIPAPTPRTKSPVPWGTGAAARPSTTVKAK